MCPLGNSLSILNRLASARGELREFFELFLADPDLIGADGLNSEFAYLFGLTDV